MDPTHVPLLPMTAPRTLTACAGLDAKPSSELPLVIVASYPKSGTTWMQSIVYHLATRGRVPLEHISDHAPFFENDASWVHNDDGTSDVAPRFAAGHAVCGVRMFNTHLRWSQMPASPSARFIYLVRSPRDVLLSFYEHLSHQAPEDGGYTRSLDEFVSEWVSGSIVFGSWAAHLRSWLQDEAEALGRAGRDERVLVVSFEELRADLRSTCIKVAGHLGIGALSEADLERALPHLSFAAMKAHAHRYQPRSVRWMRREGDEEDFCFIRKGEVGGARRVLGPDHELAVQKMLEREARGAAVGTANGVEYLLEQVNDGALSPGWNLLHFFDACRR